MNWSYVPMPINSDGNGPAEPDETVETLHEIWDETFTTVCTCKDEETARMIVEMRKRAVMKPIERARHALMVANGCGFTVNGERTMCDDEFCECARDAGTTINAFLDGVLADPEAMDRIVQTSGLNATFVIRALQQEASR